MVEKVQNPSNSDRLRVFENRMIRRIFDRRGMKWQEVGVKVGG
jgi:hypothetical protein